MMEMTSLITARCLRWGTSVVGAFLDHPCWNLHIDKQKGEKVCNQLKIEALVIEGANVPLKILPLV